MKMTMIQGNEKHNIYDSGFDRHLIRKSVAEEEERQFQQRIKEERDERERRERIRIQRIAASGKSRLLYTLDVIIEKCLMDEKSDRIEIDFYSLGFPDNIQEVMGAHRFLNQLKDAGCFKDVERSANTYFIVAKPSIEKLNEHKSKLERKIGIARPEAMQTKISLTGKGIVFDDDEATIKVGSKICQLPPYKNEHYFCRAMFAYPAKEPIDWSTIYQKMTGSEPTDERKNARTVQDTVYAVNKRVQEVIGTNDEIFSWQNKTIKINF